VSEPEKELKVAEESAGLVSKGLATGKVGTLSEPVFVGDIRDRALSQPFLEFQSADVDFHQPLRHEPWGARTFVVRDPDGNLVLFGAPAD
jgi:hypothetical protein